MNEQEKKGFINKIATSGITLYAAILGVFAALAKIFYELNEKHPQGSITFTFLIIAIPAILILMYLVFYKSFTIKLSKNTIDLEKVKAEYEENSQRLNSLIEGYESSKTKLTKETIKCEFGKEFSRLDGIIKSADEHRNNLLHHFVITWEQSSRWELNAEEVWSVTPNLIWTLVFRKEKITDICKNRSHKYKYIVRGNLPIADKCIDTINNDIHIILAEFISENSASFELSSGIFSKTKINELIFDIRCNFQIKRLITLDKYKNLDCNIQIPLPGDMVIYKDMPIYNEKKEIIPKTVAIISLFAIEKYNPNGIDIKSFDIDKIDQKHKYDVQIEDEMIFNDYFVWFNRVWNKLEAIKDSNEVVLVDVNLYKELNKRGINRYE